MGYFDIYHLIFASTDKFKIKSSKNSITIRTYQKTSKKLTNIETYRKTK